MEQEEQDATFSICKSFNTYRVLYITTTNIAERRWILFRRYFSRHATPSQQTLSLHRCTSTVNPSLTVPAAPSATCPSPCPTPSPACRVPTLVSHLCCGLWCLVRLDYRRTLFETRAEDRPSHALRLLRRAKPESRHPQLATRKLNCICATRNLRFRQHASHGS
jgi:hypothetical protein